MASKRQKNPDFTQNEMLELVSNVKLYWKSINNSFSSSLNNETKKKCWGMVEAAVNAVGKTPRTVDQVSFIYKI
jgi:Myb/SANT-like DNA-binding domain